MEQAAPRVAVVGSLVMDLVFRVDRRPAPGESVFGESFELGPGGKGFNQAVAARRCGARVELVGRVGDDEFGQAFRAFLAGEGIDTTGITTDPLAGTGVASPIVDRAGQNAIVVVPRANMAMTVEDVRRRRAALALARALLVQHEVPPAVSAAAAGIVKTAGGIVILNPAPAAALDSALLEQVDILVPNETEVLACVGGAKEPAAAAVALARATGKTVVLTLGAAGALVVESGTPVWHAAFAVECLDSTGAGDAFCAGLAVALAEGRDLPAAIRFAGAAGAVAVTKPGTGSAMPYRAEVERLLAVR